VGEGDPNRTGRVLGIWLAASWAIVGSAACNWNEPFAWLAPAVTGECGVTEAQPVEDSASQDSDRPESSPSPDATPLPDEPPDDDLLEGTPNAEYLDTLSLAHVRVGDQVFLVWVADDFRERERGLMYVTAEEMEPLADGRRRGMLFVWTQDNDTGFWMRNTIIPLDVAFICEDGFIDSIQTMVPLDESIYPSDNPYRYALEVTAGTFAELGVGPGDLAELGRAGE
jgi:hypothetical protein